MVLIVTTRNYFNFSGIITQLVSSLQELILGSCFLPTPLGYSSFTHVVLGPHGLGGARILLQRSVPRSEIAFRTPLHDVDVHTLLHRVYGVFSLYLVPVVSIARDDLVELLRQLPKSFLLVVDFNIRHPSWGDTVASNYSPVF